MEIKKIYEEMEQRVEKTHNEKEKHFFDKYQVDSDPFIEEKWSSYVTELRQAHNKALSQLGALISLGEQPSEIQQIFFRQKQSIDNDELSVLGIKTEEKKIHAILNVASFLSVFGRFAIGMDKIKLHMASKTIVEMCDNDYANNMDDCIAVLEAYGTQTPRETKDCEKTLTKSII